MTIGVLLLAAGRSIRYGSDKRSVVLPSGKTMLHTTLDAIEKSGFPVLVCLSPDDQEIGKTIVARGLNRVLCKTAAQGMGHTLAEGVAHLPAWDGVLVALADMPFIQAATYRQVAAAVKPHTICRPECNGRPGHPVGFGKQYFQELAEMSGDEGARRMLRRNSATLIRLKCADSGIHRDIDTIDDL